MTFVDDFELLMLIAGIPTEGRKIASTTVLQLALRLDFEAKVPVYTRCGSCLTKYSFARWFLLAKSPGDGRPRDGTEFEARVCRVCGADVKIAVLP